MISIKNTYKKFGDDKIIFNDMVFEDNKSYVILGPSGCGKSTLLNLISGNIQPTKGEIQIKINDKQFKINKLSYNELQKFRRDKISYVSQEFNLFDNFTVYDNLKLINEVKNTEITVEEAAELVGFSKKLKQKVKTLSGGEKQRVCIARALLQNGEIIICDEPTGSLNESLAHDIIRLLIDLQKKLKSTLIVVTHDERLTLYFDEVIHHNDLIKMNIGGNK